MQWPIPGIEKRQQDLSFPTALPMKLLRRLRLLLPTFWHFTLTRSLSPEESIKWYWFAEAASSTGLLHNSLPLNNPPTMFVCLFGWLVGMEHKRNTQTWHDSPCKEGYFFIRLNGDKYSPDSNNIWLCYSFSVWICPHGLSCMPEVTTGGLTTNSSCWG